MPGQQKRASEIKRKKEKERKSQRKKERYRKIDVHRDIETENKEREKVNNKIAWLQISPGGPNLNHLI